jgi:UDP-N-acetylglucosamine 2-epimerase (non-hydrolysing)
MKLVVVAGARPNFMKVAPLMWEIARRLGAHGFLVHTGQHYDEKMSKLFFEQLNIPRPDVDLEVGSGSHAVQTAEVMKRFEPVVLAERPDAVVVVGDVNSTLACALTAVKLGVPVAHVEAGLRSFDTTMPEEINRLLTDAVSRWLFVSEPSGLDNLRREGFAADRVFHVGNVMIDTLVACQAKFEQTNALDAFGVTKKQYAVLTLHRPANVDDPTTFRGLLGALHAIQKEIPVIFPVHPRTRKALAAERVDLPNVRLTEPLGYLEFMSLVTHARFVMTDSGGIQEETTYLGVPCLTLRNNTERPVTIETGTNVLVGLTPEKIVAASRAALRAAPATLCRVPELWDGLAARRILDVLLR